MSPYAEDTTVSTEKSRGEIERTLSRYGATAFAYGWTGQDAMIQFEANDRRVRFVVRLPDRDDPRFRLTPSGKYERTPAQREAEYEKACRQKWRALALVVKAKLEAVDAGISEFEDEFLAHIVLPDGRTAGEWLRPQIEETYRSGKMPSMLPALGMGS